MHEIIPYLWLGDHSDAQNISEDISLIVNCTRNIPFFSESASKIRVPVDDTPDDNEFILHAWMQTDLFDKMLSSAIILLYF